jgi:nodulation protein S (NodS)
MQGSASKLVLVAHPGDETFAFSSVCAEADVVSATDGGWEGRAEAFHRACDQLGAQRATVLHLPDIHAGRLPTEVLANRLAALGPYSRVYTHSPLEKNSQHRDVALAASQTFDEVWVRSDGGFAAEAHVLSPSTFQQKLDLVNSLYGDLITGVADNNQRCGANVMGVEAFAPVRFPEVVRAFTYASQEICPDVPDVWAFETSPYEQKRYDQTCALLAHLGRNGSPASILEIGACEGAMTRRLRTLFPAAKIRAVEANPIFARRLREAVGHDANTDIVEASLLDVSLSADLVLLAEVLYFVSEQLPDILASVRAQYILTSYLGPFDERVSLYLQRYGWQNILSAQILPRFEPVDGRTSALVVQRPGTHIRLWKLF